LQSRKRKERVEEKDKESNTETEDENFIVLLGTTNPAFFSEEDYKFQEMYESRKEDDCPPKEEMDYVMDEVYEKLGQSKISTIEKVWKAMNKQNFIAFPISSQHLPLNRTTLQKIGYMFDFDKVRELCEKDMDSETLKKYLRASLSWNCNSCPERPMSEITKKVYLRTAAGVWDFLIQ
jgi:hypothetical protein